MPIRINLLAESLAQEDLRRRDPVKRSIIGGALIVAVTLVWFSSNWLESLLANSKLSGIDAEIQARSADYGQILINQKKITDSQRRLDSLQKLTMTRFLQGDLMEAFQKVYVPNVQALRLRLDQIYVVTAGSAPMTNAYGVVPGKVGSSIERIGLTLDAKDSSASGDGHSFYKDSVLNQSFFKSQLNLTNGVRLNNLSAPQPSADGHPFVVFTLECRFLDKIR